MKRAMIDIETLASTNAGAVIAIGTVIFDEDQFYAEQEILIDPRLAIGDRTMDTWRFWNEQEENVRLMMFSGKTEPWNACVEMAGFFQQWKPDEVWANPPTFDLIILRSLFAACGEKTPWHYRAERCMKTSFLEMLKMGYAPPVMEQLNKHSAIADARFQAKRQQDVLRFQRRIDLLNKPEPISVHPPKRQGEF